MAKSRYEYVKKFEQESILLPETYIVVRVDGRGFHKLSERYEFEKPNDSRALEVMNSAALQLMKAMPDILLAYGDSDEYSFLLRKGCELFERREFKLVSTFASTITSYYQFYWSQIIPDKPLGVDRLPTFDARAVCYPNAELIKDYFRWRQVDCHINNLYNTTFWSLVKSGLTTQEAENKLLGTLSSDKQEILFKEFGINYNNEPEIYKKGTVFVREVDFEAETTDLSKRQAQRLQKKLTKSEIHKLHCDIIKDEFWETRPFWGILKADILSFSHEINSLAEADAPSFKTTAQLIVCPYFSSGTAYATDSSTHSWLLNAVSISKGEIFSPPLLMTSFNLPLRHNLPLSSNMPKSPVLKYVLPSWLKYEFLFADSSLR
ncbi:hypothetical protein OGAPHI_002654 [Ogataea philodendri]|uniref:tRNA(His) guanylyltransferase n=1 Tax=Ogataea philodendri TaxID=1378263 RepID=A0A9P8T7X0_9ASCO|nr:uncharacterized protein OGAPHI_002654 [Ogataea philodendri]KAH3668899.1 hypothetical protein OGAPHI_002654 [Ogataea philodendri]